MNVRPIAPDEIQLVAGWLTEEENYRWLDFGAGRQAVDAVTLKVMTQRDLHALRVYTPDDDDRPVGLVGLSDINRAFRTGTLWCVLGDKDYGRQGLTVRALSRLLTTAFDELALEAVNAWTLENNPGGQRILDLLHFRLIGRQRRCHYIDGRPLDRLWYDLLAEEHRELGEPMSGAEPTVGHIEDRVNRIFRDRLHLELPSVDTDVVETGTLDSLMFAELIVRLEEEFDTEIDVAEIELDDFRTVSRIARFLAHRRGQDGPRVAPEPGAP